MQETTVVVRDLPDGSEVTLAGPDAVCAGTTALSCAVAGWLEHVLTLPVEAGVRWLDEDRVEGSFGMERGAGEERFVIGPTGRVRMRQSAVQGALEAVLSVRLAGEPFWMFRRRPLAFLPSSGDRAFVEDLDRRWHGFEAEVREGALGSEREAARRRLLLAEVEEAGLLERGMLVERLYWLRVWGLPEMASVQAAARDLWDYFRSAERARHLGETPPGRLVGSRVSLEWMRGPAPVPEDWAGPAWLAVCERCLREMEPLPPTASGKLVLAQGPVSAQLRWRREDGEHAALYAARLSVRGMPSDA